jgi:hypothetical protein
VCVGLGLLDPSSDEEEDLEQVVSYKDTIMAQLKRKVSKLEKVTTHVQLYIHACLCLYMHVIHTCIDIHTCIFRYSSRGIHFFVKYAHSEDTSGPAQTNTHTYTQTGT